jgi:hypothetical protein
MDIHLHRTLPGIDFDPNDPEILALHEGYESQRLAERLRSLTEQLAVLEEVRQDIGSKADPLLKMIVLANASYDAHDGNEALAHEASEIIGKAFVSGPPEVRRKLVSALDQLDTIREALNSRFGDVQQAHRAAFDRIVARRRGDASAEN